MIRFGGDEVVELTRGIWGSMLRLELMPVETSSGLNFVSPTGMSGSVAGCVQIAGAWTGAVRIDCSEDFAKRTAAAFFQLQADEVSREEMLDALGEVTNMIAGSVKALLPKPCHVSLPSVVDGADYELNIRKGRVLLTSMFDNNGELLKVSILERSDPTQ